MSSAERNRIGASCIASVSFHALALGTATYFAAPQMPWEADVVRGRAGIFVVSIAAENSTPSPTVELEIEPVELEPLDETPEIEPNDAPLKPASSEFDIVSELKHSEHALESIQPTDLALASHTTVNERLPEIMMQAGRRREKKKLPVTVHVVGADLSVAAPAPIIAPAGAAFDVPPRKLPENKPPVYPVEARLNRHEGRVSLVVFVGQSGSVSRVSIDHSSGHKILDDAALRAVQEWQFEPATLDGIAVPSEIIVPIRFTLSPV